MRPGKIKTEWASLSLAADGKVIVCAKFNGSPSCILFDSPEQLKQAIDNRRLYARKWAVAVSKNSCILKSVTLPASDMTEAAKMLEFEVSSLVPLSPDEFVYGCTLVERQPNMLKVLVCILKLSELNEYLETCNKIGFRSHRIVFDSLAVQNWFDTSGDDAHERAIIVLVDEKRCYVQTGIDGNLAAANELAMVDTDVIASSDEIVDEIFHQMQDLPDSSKETVLIKIAGVEEYVSQIKKLILSDVRAWSLSKNISIVPNPVITCHDGSNKYKLENYSFAAVVASGLFGLADDAKYSYANLLPREHVKRYEKRVLLFDYLRVACLFLLLLLFIWLSLAVSNHRIEKKSRLITARIAPIELVAGGVDSKRRRVIAIKNQLSDRGRIGRIIDELYQYTPKTISVSELNFVGGYGGASIEIKGQADSMPAAFDLTDAMSKAKLLSGIQVENVQQTPGPGGSIITFKAYCDIQEESFK